MGLVQTNAKPSGFCKLLAGTQQKGSRRGLMDIIQEASAWGFLLLCCTGTVADAEEPLQASPLVPGDLTFCWFPGREV